MATSDRGSPRTNFGFLEAHDEQLVRLGMLAERYFPDDPNTSLLKLRQLAELLAQLVATKVGVYTSREEAQYDLLRRLQDQNILPREVAQLFGEVRRAGNSASHDIAGDHRTALMALRMTWQLGVWFHRTFAEPGFKSGPFVPPAPPQDEGAELRAELESLRKALAEHQAAHNETAARLAGTEAKLREAKDEQGFWEQMATEADQAKVALEQKLAQEQQKGAAQPRATVASLVTAAAEAAGALELDEGATRKLIDQQLREAGWTVDSVELRYSKGARPEKGKNLAIAEWPTKTGPSDYVLFIGLTPVAAVEAKRKNLDVSGSLQQAKRYARDFIAVGDLPHGGPWGEYLLPFVFSTNGRPYLRQLATFSGTWFCDVRNTKNLSRALDGWYTPDGLAALLKRDEAKAHDQLKKETFSYGFPLRHYQEDAIRAAEAGIASGKRELLLAMATGTGKTKTCVALIYRLLKAQRFRRILFLVDRSALGQQAADAFRDTQMENLQRFADVFGIKELGDQKPDSDTLVHIATVQGMVKRALFPEEGAPPPAVDQYDCIIVDECHRGYLLDRDLSETELGFRGFDDYISKYRRVLDYFDAVKVGLTATPALHTTEIFGVPIFSYGYREAVIDGYLVDHEPPIQVRTELSTNGIVWKAGEEVAVYNPNQGQVALFTAPDEIRIEVEDFNRKVVTESFNRVVCDYLATELDPSSQEKTLIFCANDAHADLVVDLLKKAFAARYGDVDDDAVLKITGVADKPLQLFRRYKNERYPNVAVTVDLLTTGIDVPKICNLVFLRRVSSRILFDQMLGRATRLCDEIGKESFRIFDAVRIYEALEKVTAMQPVVVNPTLSFKQLAEEMATARTDEERALIRDQIVAKLQRKKRHLTEGQLQDFEATAGMPPDAFLRQLRTMSLQDVADWFLKNQELGEIVDRKGPSQKAATYVSSHEDSLLGAEHGYGKGTKPGDYIKEFTAFVKSHGNEIPALMTVVTRPRELTRKQLRELRLALDQAGFSEANLTTAWRELTNQEIAAGIIGYIRQAALGDTLEPYDLRVDKALQKVLASKPWTKPQREWLQRIAAQTKANFLVDRAALDEPDLIFKREGGGFARLDKVFEGGLQQVLDTFNESLWPAA
jgi:type I restriction enzyme R subunit